MLLIKILIILLICIFVALDLMCLIAKDTSITTRAFVFFFSTCCALVLYGYCFM